MKINWGYKITFVYLVFVTGIIYLVIRASGESYDMVTKDYYEEELKYQQVIDAAGRTAALSGPVVVKNEGGNIIVNFPEDFRNKTIRGQYHLYFPADEKKDSKSVFEISSLLLSKELPESASGFYILKLSWTVDQQTYYHEENIFI